MKEYLLWIFDICGVCNIYLLLPTMVTWMICRSLFTENVYFNGKSAVEILINQSINEGWAKVGKV